MRQKLCVLFFCLTCLTTWAIDKDWPASEKEKVMAADTRRPLHDEKFYEKLLEAFCQKHFDERFAFKKFFGRGAVKYHKGSLRVESVAPRDTKTDKVQGKITYDYAYGAQTCRDGEFIAFIKNGTESNEYIVVLERCGGFFSQNMKTTGEMSFIYPE